MSRSWGGSMAVAARRAWAPEVSAGRIRCRRCGQLITSSQEWDVGHVTDIAAGGSPRGRTHPEHARKADCPAGGNRSAGGQLGAALRRRSSSRIRDWLA